MTTAADPSLTMSLTLDELRGIKLIAEICLAKPRDGGSPEGSDEHHLRSGLQKLDAALKSAES